MIKKSILLFAACASFVTVSYGQKCATDEVFQEARKANIQVDQLQKVLDDAWRTSFNASMSNSSSTSKTTGGSIDPWAGYPASRAQKTIVPVVVHIVHDYGSEYISDNAVFTMIKEMNDRYNARNADLSQVIDPFQPIIGNANIEFRLAQKDPVGNPTTGITRKRSYLTKGGDEQAKFDLWAPNRYLNIWMVRVIGRGTAGGTVLAYATPPSSGAANPYGDGVLSIASEATGGIAGKSTIAHETGHYLNLAHPWNSSGAGAGVSCGDDDVDDTPPTKGHFGASGNCENWYYLYDTNCAVLNSPIPGGFDDFYVDSVTYLSKKRYFDNTISWSNLNTYMASRDTSSTLQMSMQKGIAAPAFTAAPSIASYVVLVTDSIKKPNGMRPGRIVNGLIDTLGNPKAGQPYTLRTKKMIGFYKYQANGSDQGFASVALTKWNSTTSKRDTIAYSLNNFAASSSWKYFSFPITYTSNNPAKPDSAIVVLSASSANSSLWAKGSTLQLDHVLLVDGEDGYFKTTTAGDTADYADIANTQNIMDYADCEINFTKQQVMRMRAALLNNVGNRNNLITQSNWQSTGIGDTAISTYVRNDLRPVPDFSVEKGLTAGGTYYMCGDASHPFYFKNQSWRDTVTSVAWSFSNGANPSTSTSTASVNVNFSQPGWATISMKATGNNSGDSSIERKAVYVADPNYVINPMNGYFQEFTDATENDKWPIFNYYENEFKWELNNKVGFYDHSCIVFNGYDTRTYPTGLVGAPAVVSTASGKAGDYDDFFTPAFDLTGMASNANCNLNFMFAGAWRTNASSLMNDSLEITYSTDCGTSWSKLKDLTKADLVYGTYANSFAPLSMNDWYEQNIAIPTSARQSKVMFRFRYKPMTDGSSFINLGVGNNYYVDRINVSPFATSVKGLHSNSMNIGLAPNPTRTNTAVIISNNLNNNASVTVTDMTGKVVYRTQKVLVSNLDRIEIPETAIAVKGFYMVQVVAGTETKTEKLVSY
jgi:hypothetical protein